MMRKGAPGMSGWVRACAECGSIDRHSLFPNPDMAVDPHRRCGDCLAPAIVARHADLDVPSP